MMGFGISGLRSWTCRDTIKKAALARRTSRRSGLGSRFARNVWHVAEIADRDDAARRVPQLDEVARLRRLAIAVHRDDLASIEPGWHEMPVMEPFVIREVVTDVPL